MTGNPEIVHMCLQWGTRAELRRASTRRKLRPGGQCGPREQGRSIDEAKFVPRYPRLSSMTVTDPQEPGASTAPSGLSPTHVDSSAPASPCARAHRCYTGHCGSGLLSASWQENPWDQSKPSSPEFPSCPTERQEPLLHVPQTMPTLGPPCFSLPSLPCLEPMDKFWWSATRQGGGTVLHPALPPQGLGPLQALPLAFIPFHKGLQSWQCP